MITREIEICPHCGQFDPWRKGKRGKSLTIKGERRLYVVCKRCGAHEVIVYRKKKGQKHGENNADSSNAMHRA
jgi:RNase P subunit RPR2